MSSAIVVGAGIFGGSLAHELVERGWKVTLVDRYPPGHVRAASSGEARLIRSAHGAEAWYVRSARRAWERWLELEQETGESLLLQCGVVWLAHDEAGWEAESERALRAGRTCSRAAAGGAEPCGLDGDDDHVRGGSSR